MCTSLRIVFEAYGQDDRNNVSFTDAEGKISKNNGIKVSRNARPRWITTVCRTDITPPDNEKEQKKKYNKRKQRETLSLGEEGKPKLNSSLNSSWYSVGGQHEKSAANGPNYFSILPKRSMSRVCARARVVGWPGVLSLRITTN